MSEREGEVWMDVDYVIPRAPKSTRTLRAFTPEQLRAHDDRIRAEALAPVLALAEEATERAYMRIAAEMMLTIQPNGPDRAVVPPHWRDRAEAHAVVPVAALRATAGTPTHDEGCNCGWGGVHDPDNPRCALNAGTPTHHTTEEDA